MKLNKTRALIILSVAELLGMSLWLTGSALTPVLTVSWDLSPSQAAWLTTIVQLGFVVGTALTAVLNLADLVPSRSMFAACAVGGAVANAAMIHLALATPAIDADTFPCDILSPFYYDEDILTEPLPIKAGEARAPHGPGLGVELDEEKVEFFRVK